MYNRDEKKKVLRERVETELIKFYKVDPASVEYVVIGYNILRYIQNEILVLKKDNVVPYDNEKVVSKNQNFTNLHLAKIGYFEFNEECDVL